MVKYVHIVDEDIHIKYQVILRAEIEKWNNFRWTVCTLKCFFSNTDASLIDLPVIPEIHLVEISKVARLVGLYSERSS